MTLHTPAIIRSKRALVQATQQLKLVGQFNITGTRPPRDGEEAFMMVNVIGFGVDIWLQLSKPIPQVEGADAVVLQCRLAKTKSKRFAVTPFALLSVSVDGETVWEGDAIEDKRGEPEDLDKTVGDVLPIENAPRSSQMAEGSKAPTARRAAAAGGA